MKHLRFSFGLFLLGLMMLSTSCLSDSSAVYSYTGAWGTVYADSKSGAKYVRSDYLYVPMSHTSFSNLTPGNRVVLDYSLDASKYTALPSGEDCYDITVSNMDEVKIETPIILSKGDDPDVYGKHPFDETSLYQAIITNGNKEQILSLTASYSGADDTYPISLLKQDSDSDTLKLELRCNAGEKTGTRSYLWNKAYSITPFIGDASQKTIQLTTSIKTSTGVVESKSYVEWKKATTDQ